MKWFSITIIVVIFCTPIYLLNYVVMPQLEAMRYNYSHFDEVANAVVNDKD